MFPQQGFVRCEFIARSAANSLFPPQMDVSAGEPPLASHTPPWQLASLGKARYGRPIHPQMASEAFEIKVRARHSSVVWDSNRRLSSTTSKVEASRKKTGL
jgi:hypothetical protein